MSGKGYVLARGFRPSTRLNFQFYLWQEALGFSVHPAIDLNKPDLKVADVATGTGIWLTELSKHLPASAQLDGFDLSADQFAHPKCLPANVRLQICDATKNPPESLIGVYDIVHVRLLLAAIEGDDPSPVLCHCQKLLSKSRDPYRTYDSEHLDEVKPSLTEKVLALEPGGILQWDEIDPHGFTPVSQLSDLGSPCLEKICHIFRYTKPTRWIHWLPKFFEKNNFEVIANETHTEKQWQRQMMMEIWCLTTDDFASEMDVTGPPGKGDELRQLIDGAYAEIKNGEFYSHSIRVVIGKAIK